MTVANRSTGKISHLPVIGIVPSQNTTEKMVSFPERYADAIIKAGGAPLLLPLSGNSHIYETLFPLIDGLFLPVAMTSIQLAMALFAIAVKSTSIRLSVKSLST